MSFHQKDMEGPRREVLVSSNGLGSLGEEISRSLPPLYRYPRWRQRLSSVFFLIGMALFLGYLYCIHQSVIISQRAKPSPVSYDVKWKPDRNTYKPGDVVKFSFERTSQEDQLILLTLDTWQNTSTEEVFPGPILGRIARKGTQKVTTFRQIPENATPGIYVLAGLVSPQTHVKTMPASYESEPFEVVTAHPRTKKATAKASGQEASSED